MYTTHSVVFTVVLDIPAKPRVRLVGGSSTLEGRVEIYYNDQWGTICNDEWDIDDATVVCHQLGFHGDAEAIPNSIFGVGSQSTPIWLTNVLCTGTEDYLADCPHNSWGNNNCHHYQDVGVICTGME